MTNSLKDLMDYLGCSSKEFREVWNEMSEQEKEEWKNADLTS